MTKEKTKKILQTLDREYGVTKDGFLHTADWQLCSAPRVRTSKWTKSSLDCGNDFPI